MLSKIFRTEQPLLFCGDGRENQTAFWFGGGAGKCPRHFQENATAGRVVRSAVIDVVAGLIGMDTQMIIVRGVHHGLLLELVIRASDLSDHVARGEMAAPW